MSILKRQQRIVEVGIIRIGEKGISGSGKEYPRSRETFRITSKFKDLLDVAQKVYGGEVRQWKDHPGHWELLSEAKTIKGLFSTRETGDGELESLIQHFEQWKGNTCTHRCNGETCEVWKQIGNDKKDKPIYDKDLVPCSCEHDGDRDCKLVSRVRVILPEVPSLGLWRLNTGSETFAGEVEGLIANIKTFRLDQYGPVPVTLTISTREKRTGPNAATEKFPVVEILLDQNPVSLPQLVSGIQAAALGVRQESSNAGLGALPAPAPILTTSTVEPVPSESNEAEKEKRFRVFAYHMSLPKEFWKSWQEKAESVGLNFVDTCLAAEAKGVSSQDELEIYLDDQVFIAKKRSEGVDAAVGEVVE